MNLTAMTQPWWKGLVVANEVLYTTHDLHIVCDDRMMWAAGSLASVSMITYPAISALVSCNAEADQQG